MIARLSRYVPQDRRRALAQGLTLPDPARGSALFADISGFTPLTEKLTHDLGARRGIEELTRQINVVYDALIGAVDRYGGSVIDFAGDAVTCWFDEGDGQAAARAVAAAGAMQAAMATFDNLALKVAVTSGSARRFVVGDATIQVKDTLAGAMVARLATGEHLAQRGEILLDEATVEAVGAGLAIRGWRVAERGERFAILLAASSQPPLPLPDTMSAILAAEALQPWLLPPVFRREQDGHGSFLTELRPTVALFLRFAGIDFDGDAGAGAKLDAVIQRVQRIVARYDGALLQLTIGDKGSYLYGSFGALVAHEDDSRRAVQAALELARLPETLPFLHPVQLGLSRGTMRVGGYGSATRRTYGALGDETNLAARLMAAAAPGEILVSERVQRRVRDGFDFEPRSSLRVKGKAAPVAVWLVTGPRRQRAIRLEEPSYALPMVGRQPELAWLDEKLGLALQGKGQVVGITAEAGMGKSRLVAEAIRLARGRGFNGYGGACASSGVNTAWLVWKPIWQAFFEVDPAAPLAAQRRNLEQQLERRAPTRVSALPVLAPLLDLSLEETDFTRALEPKERRDVLVALLEECLKSAAREEPLLLVLEDLHWIDPLSHDLLETLARVSAMLPVCFVLAYRPPEQARLRGSAPRVEALPHFTRIPLDALTAAEAEQVIAAKLARLFPEAGGTVPQPLAAQLAARAEGNPFFLEELLNFLRDRAINPFDGGALGTLDLPSSLHALILSRVDPLTEPQKVTLKAASIIGRLFRLDWLRGYFPALGGAERVKDDLAQLARLDLTPLDTPEPELAYGFKHIVTREAVYESLTFAARARLHEQLACFIETLGPDLYLDLLAYHFGLSQNLDKQREYLKRAGEAARAAYANEAALDYYARLLPLIEAVSERLEIHLAQGAVLQLLGRWAEAETQFCEALALAPGAAQADHARARCEQALGALFQKRGDYDVALAWLERARAAYERLGDHTGLGQTLNEIGGVLVWQGEYARASQFLENSLTLARALGDRRSIADALNRLGHVAIKQDDIVTAQRLFQESLLLRREIGDKAAIGLSLNNLGLAANAQGDNAAAQRWYEESWALLQEIGHKHGVAAALINLGVLAQEEGDSATAWMRFEEGLALARELGDRRQIIFSLDNLANVAVEQDRYADAQALYAESLVVAQGTGNKVFVAYFLNGLAAVAAGLGTLARAARLAAATETLRASLELAWDPIEQRIAAHTLSLIRAGLSEAEVSAAWAEGGKLTLEEAVQLALPPQP